MSSIELPICVACGSQYDASPTVKPTRCKICDVGAWLVGSWRSWSISYGIQDPRQFVPPSGQSWTTLSDLQKSHENKWQQDPHDPRVTCIWTEPKVLDIRHLHSKSAMIYTKRHRSSPSVSVLYFSRHRMATFYGIWSLFLTNQPSTK